jgi:trehalose synthase
MIPTLDSYAPFVGQNVLRQLRQLSAPLRGASVVHVNSTRAGGGVAEILHRLIPLQRELGLDASWEVIEGDAPFFDITKGFHNSLQGQPVAIRPHQLEHFLEVNRQNAARLGDALAAADFVFIHDPQPAALLRFTPERRGQWVWRCHIDASRPQRPTWKFLRELVGGYDASVFSLAAFAQPLPHPEYLVPPAIDPLSEKNVELSESEIAATAERLGLAPDRPVLLQVSRFDRFKDPVGVVRAFRMVRSYLPAQLVLAGSSAADDPEGEAVLEQVREEAGGDPEISLLMLPPDDHRTINALQRRADVVLQKSLREGFGLTVTEALWKRRPMVAGDAGGITLQVIPNRTGFLVHTPEGAALRIRFLLQNREIAAEMGERGREHVRENFLLTRQLRDYLTLMNALAQGAGELIELDA